jgi:hypothetical protein
MLLREAEKEAVRDPDLSRKSYSERKIVAVS